MYERIEMELINNLIIHNLIFLIISMKSLIIYSSSLNSFIIILIHLVNLLKTLSPIFFHLLIISA